MGHKDLCILVGLSFFLQVGKLVAQGEISRHGYDTANGEGEGEASVERGDGALGEAAEDDLGGGDAFVEFGLDEGGDGGAGLVEAGFVFLREEVAELGDVVPTGHAHAAVL